MLPLQVGALLHGFCNGHFGRDSYGHKRVEAVGADWIVARESDGTPVFCEFGPVADVAFSTVYEWLQPTEECRDCRR